MKKYRCVICGHVYDPAVGDAENDIPPETPFDNIVETWVCPDCGAPKAEFEPVEE